MKIKSKQARMKRKPMQSNSSLTKVLAPPAKRRHNYSGTYDTDIVFDTDFDVPYFNVDDLPDDLLNLDDMHLDCLLSDMLVCDTEYDIDFPILEFPEMNGICEPIKDQYTYTATMIIHDFYSNPDAEQCIINWANSSMAKSDDYSLKSFMEYNDIKTTTRNEILDVLDDWLNEIKDEHHLLK
jgi:hypothetical protein